MCLQKQQVMESLRPGVTCGYEQTRVSSGICCWKSRTCSVTLNHIDSGRHVLFLNYMYVLDALLCFDYKYVVELLSVFSNTCNTWSNYIYNEKTTFTCKCLFNQCFMCSNNRFVKLAFPISIKTWELWSAPIWSIHILLCQPLVYSILSSLWPKANYQNNPNEQEEWDFNGIFLFHLYMYL